MFFISSFYYIGWRGNHHHPEVNIDLLLVQDVDNFTPGAGGWPITGQG